MPRPRDERVSAAVLDAVRDLMAENGYSRLTLQGVADRAGTTTPAVRRRWPSLRHLVVDALAEERAGVVEPDAGCVACDLSAHVEALGAALGGADTGRVLPALVADLADDPELRARFLERFWQPRREACLVSLRAAMERGEVRRDVDPALVIDVVAGLSCCGISSATPASTGDWPRSSWTCSSPGSGLVEVPGTRPCVEQAADGRRRDGSPPPGTRTRSTVV